MRDWVQALLAGIGLAAAVLLGQWILAASMTGSMPLPTVASGYGSGSETRQAGRP